MMPPARAPLDGDDPPQAPSKSQRSSSMAKVLIIQPFHEDGMALLEARDDVDFEIVDGRSEAELAERIRDADAATIRTAPLPAKVIDQALREGTWEIRNRFETVDLMGRRVLILGYGRIGREVAKRCAGFDMKVSV